MQHYTQLRVWQRSHRLALEVYRITATFPKAERFGLTAQVRRAAVSISANIAEGAKRQSNPDYARFLNIAEGSLAETEALLRLSVDLQFGNAIQLRNLMTETDEISRMVYSLRMTVSNEGARANLEG